MKCDEKEAVREKLFEPESPNVIVCEGFHEMGLVCALLRHLEITNCDATYPKKEDGGNGKDAIKKLVELLAGRASTIRGLLIVADADEDPATAFTRVTEAFCAPFPAPDTPFTIFRKKDRKTGAFLMPGNGKTGALEHLLLEVVSAEDQGAIRCIEAFEQCSGKTADWSANKLAKMRFACYVASHCKNDPCCSTAFIWARRNHVLDIASPVFNELSAILKDFSAD